MDKFVLNVPEWQGELLFTKEMLAFVSVIILLLVGILLCFWGYKYFRTVLFLGIGAVVCYVSFLLIEPMTGNPVVRMFLTVSLTFLGICIVYFLDIILGYFMDRLRLGSILGKNIYLFAAPLGAVIIGLTVYWFIWRGLAVSAVTAGGCGLIGLIFQHINRKKTVRFRCYNDLLQMPRPKADENGLEYIVMDPAVTAGVATAVADRTRPVTEFTAEIRAERIADEPEPAAAEAAVAEEPEPGPESGVSFMPESEREPVMEPGPEPAEAVVAEEPEPGPESGVSFMPESEWEPVMEPGPEPAAAEAAVAEEPEPGLECAVQPMPVVLDTEPAVMETMELSDTIRSLISGGIEPQEDILEDALFVRQMKESVAAGRQVKQLDIGLAAMAAGRHVEAVTAAQREAADVMNKAADAMSKAADAMNRAAESASETDMAGRRRRKLHRKQDNRFAKGVAVAVAGIGLFFAGRASKGRDLT